ncbi:hypothetical protein Snas_5423 [Stackebrandtia nassauensis DSM 44728]|uniref:Helix-turn-helix domain-containing protein n=1 Tax=Stackebrandtia nassauensis (strain DSM 44728 / CIP 108903 / NRRL B-16338 / NBRC 102104 / LLR-40K-21) TaxID=446470 RepID=D3PVT4_STANL|nr:hypothetical protein Snas_5423 [Stackebrandtia nassauensis DSM 44728]
MSTTRIPRKALVWTRERVLSLGSTTTVETAGAVLGIGRTLAYQLAANGNFPVTVFRAGHLYRVPVGPLVALLWPDATPASNDVNGGGE